MILGVTETKHLSTQEKKNGVKNWSIFFTLNHFYSALLVGSLMAIRGTCIITRFHWLNTYATFTLNQSEVKSKPIATCSHSFTRAFHRLHASASRSDWFIGFSITYVIGLSTHVTTVDTHILKTILPSILLTEKQFSPGKKLELSRKLWLSLDVGCFREKLQMTSEFFTNFKLQPKSWRGSVEIHKTVNL